VWLCVIRSTIYISAVPIVFFCVGALGSCCAQEALSGRSEAAEFQKLEPTLRFLREHNARTYAITTPNGIDEATYVEVGGIEQWITIRGEDRNNRVSLFFARWARRCDQSRRVESRTGAVAGVSRWRLDWAFAASASIRFDMALFPVPAHRTGLADFPHPALGKDSRLRPRKVRGPVW
jgi:hypothetical protein